VSELGWFVQFKRSVFWRNFLETVWQPFPVNLPVSSFIKNGSFTLPVNLPVSLVSVGNRLPFSINEPLFSLPLLTDLKLSRI
jgi:hypothetical protein